MEIFLQSQEKSLKFTTECEILLGQILLNGPEFILEMKMQLKLKG